MFIKKSLAILVQTMYKSSYIPPKCTHTLKNIVPTFLVSQINTHLVTHSLTSSSSENPHKLLSPVIILAYVPIAESASMSGTVSTA